MKTYRNGQLGFAIDLPENWSFHSLGADQALIFKCGPNEAFNIQIHPLKQERTLKETEDDLMRYTYEKGYTSLSMGRMVIEDKRHVWARYYLGGGSWSKKYLIVLYTKEYTLTATCLDQKYLLDMEKVWDAVAASLQLLPSVKSSIDDSLHTRQQSATGMQTYRNPKYDFEMEIPTEWSLVTKDVPGGVVFQCPPGESANFQIGLMAPEPIPDRTERDFAEYAHQSGYTNLEFGRILAAGREHVWARYQMQFGTWTKKYLIVLGGTEFALTATGADRATLLKREPVWDRAVSSLRLRGSAQQDVDMLKAGRIKTGGQLYEQAYEAVARGDHVKARFLLEECLKDNPNHILAHKELAMVLKKMGDLNSARSHRQEVKRLDSSDVINRYNLADLLFTLGEKEAALREIKELQVLAPHNTEVQQLAKVIQQAVDSTTSTTHSRPTMPLAQIMQILARPAPLSEIPKRIDLCEQALAQVNRRADPELWAGLQIELAKNYGQNPQGDRAENIEQAILHNQNALEVFTQKVYSEYWANTQINLGANYRSRIRGERADNLEKSISFCEAGLKALNRKASPELWGSAQNNLGNAYREWMLGNRSKNLEQALYHCTQALEIFTRQSFPTQWASVHNNLGNIYHNRILGELELNIEQAIFCYQQALEVYTPLTNPEGWAWTHNNLCEVYRKRTKGDKAENLEQAIQHGTQALQVYSRHMYAERWALVQINLAGCYQVRIRGEKAENQEQALFHDQQALEVMTRTAYPENWAGTQRQLASIYMERLSGDKTENIKRALEHGQQALQVFTREAYPEDWFKTEALLSLISKNLEHGEKYGPSLTYPDLYNEFCGVYPHEPCQLKLIYAEVPEIKFATNLLLVYQWAEELSAEEMDRLRLRAAAYLACAIYDAARYTGLPCGVSPVVNGQRPTWMFAGERAPVSVVLSDADDSDKTLQMSIGPIMVAMHTLPVNKDYQKRLMEGFKSSFSDIVV